jgi:amidase
LRRVEEDEEAQDQVPPQQGEPRQAAQRRPALENSERGVHAEVAYLDATAQADLVRRGECTAVELVDAAIARVERLNPQLNAVIHHRFDMAHHDASGALPTGPFAGVPFLVKDAVCQEVGQPYHLGMRFLRDRGWTARESSELAKRFARAGFLSIGRTNTPELATSLTTEPLAYGPTHNPWNLRRSPGGSSGGSAAAVAAGLVAAAHGNDMGGSIRVPASACGLVGLKPTRARTSLAPHAGEYWGPLTHEGVLTRSVRDTAAILDAVSGPAPGDPYTAPDWDRPLAEEIGADPGRLRVGYRTRVPVVERESHPECVAAVATAARALEQAGHAVEEASPPLDEIDTLGAFTSITGVHIATELDRWATRAGDPIGADDVEPFSWMFAEIGRATSGTQYMTALDGLHDVSRRLAAFWADGFDLFVSPTLSMPLPELGVLAPGVDIAATFPVMTELAQFTPPWNLTGQPAISLPLHWTPEGLPIGVQLVAAYGREDVLIRVAAQLEQALPWHDRRPPIG